MHDRYRALAFLELELLRKELGTVSTTTNTHGNLFIRGFIAILCRTPSSLVEVRMAESTLADQRCDRAPQQLDYSASCFRLTSQSLYFQSRKKIITVNNKYKKQLKLKK